MDPMETRGPRVLQELRDHQELKEDKVHLDPLGSPEKRAKL